MGSWFDTLIDRAGPLVGELVTRAADALPKCAYCSASAIPIRCLACGQFVCGKHAYVNVGRKEVFCRSCLVELLREVGDSGVGDQSVWEILGVRPGCSRAQIERAFRKKAPSCHPDRFPGDSDKEREYRRLSMAKAAILELIAREDSDDG